MKLRHWLVLAGLLALAQSSPGQGASNWRVYKAGDGLAQTACFSVSVNPNGTILVLHSNPPAVTRLDGYSANVLQLPRSFVGEVAESPGGQLWVVTREGLAEFKEGKWISHHVAEIADAIQNDSPSYTNPVPLYAYRQGHVLFLLRGALMEFSFDEANQFHTGSVLTSGQTRAGDFSGMTVARDGGLWISGVRGLVSLARLGSEAKTRGDWSEYLVPVALGIQNLRWPREDAEGDVTLVADSPLASQTVVAHFDGHSWTTHDGGPGKILQAWRGSDGKSWAITTNSLLESSSNAKVWMTNQEVSPEQIFDAAVEPGGKFWLATSEGLFCHMPPAWRIPLALEGITSSIQCLTEDSEGVLWFVSDRKLYSLRNEIHREFPLPEFVADNPQNLRAIFALPDGNLLLDAGKLFQFKPEDASFAAISMKNNVERVAALGITGNGDVCLQCWKSDQSSTNVHLDVFDGNIFRPLVAPPANADSSGDFSTMFAARNGDLWFSSRNEVARLYEGKWQSFPVSDRNVPEPIVCFTELTDGRIWGATRDRVWEFDGRYWLSIRAGFNHINGMLRTRDGSVWVADDSGLHRFFQNIWVDNGVEEGLPVNAAREILEDRRGLLWVATPGGLSLFHPGADTDPPHTFVEKSPDKEMNFRQGRTVTLEFTGTDKWDFTPHDRLIYSYRLDERDWTTFQAMQTVSFTDLPVGKHYFQIRCMDRNGNVDPKPALLEFAVSVPWYKEIRLVLIVFVGTATALFFAALAFNRHRRLVRSYAVVEEQVATRTRELERANRELLHSQKMNALGTLAAGIAHDFNNILSIIKGSAQIIEEHPENKEKLRTRVDRIKTMVEQGSGIVNAMLGFSSNSGEQPCLCDINAVVRDTIKLLGDRFLREVEIRFEPADDLPSIVVARNLIQQILLNFIFNASEAMISRKQITLATRKLDRPPEVAELKAEEAAAYVAISVRDNGSGIEPENLSRIFEPFFTTKSLSTRRGTGLGLSMVYELAKKLEAGLAVESVIGEGSTFTLILPVRE